MSFPSDQSIWLNAILPDGKIVSRHFESSPGAPIVQEYFDPVGGDVRSL